MMSGQLESHLSKNEVASISCTLFQDEFQMEQRFQCKKWKQRSARHTMGALSYNLRLGKAILTVT